MGRIPKFYDQPIEPETLAILLSTLYFNARWKEEFLVGATKELVYYIKYSRVRKMK